MSSFVLQKKVVTGAKKYSSTPIFNSNIPAASNQNK